MDSPFQDVVPLGNIVLNSQHLIPPGPQATNRLTRSNTTPSLMRSGYTKNGQSKDVQRTCHMSSIPKLCVPCARYTLYFSNVSDLPQFEINGAPKFRKINGFLWSWLGMPWSLHPQWTVAQPLLVPYVPRHREQSSLPWMLGNCLGT